MGRGPSGSLGLVWGGPGFASSAERLCVPAGSAPAPSRTPCLWAAGQRPESGPCSGPHGAHRPCCTALALSTAPGRAPWRRPGDFLMLAFGSSNAQNL